MGVFPQQPRTQAEGCRAVGALADNDRANLVRLVDAVSFRLCFLHIDI